MYRTHCPSKPFALDFPVAEMDADVIVAPIVEDSPTWSPRAAVEDLLQEAETEWKGTSIGVSTSDDRNPVRASLGPSLMIVSDEKLIDREVELTRQQNFEQEEQHRCFA